MNVLVPDRLGSIPARAGEPRHSRRLPLRRRVYPRACGGAIGGSSTTFTTGGLSPRVRGSLDTDTTAKPDVGSIPARAGEPDWRGSASRSLRVYPRACGGALRMSIPAAGAAGLSPRVRGSPLPAVASIISDGSIPARAGEPRRLIPPPMSCWVYPRACGGAVSGAANGGAGQGLSPRVRGCKATSGTAPLASFGTAPSVGFMVHDCG